MSPRPGPASLAGTDPTGTSRELTFDAPTLVLVVKPGCESCGPFLGGAPALDGASVVVVSAHVGPWPQATAVWRAPAWLRRWEVDLAPHYLLVEPRGPVIIAEGALLDWEQVLEEIGAARA